MISRLGTITLLLSFVSALVVPVRVGAYAPPGTCQAPYVWRQVDPADHVCVTQAQRAEAAAQNAIKGRTNADGTCVAPYVWREADATDRVCVSVAERAEAAAENTAGPSHTVSLPTQISSVMAVPSAAPTPAPVRQTVILKPTQLLHWSNQISFGTNQVPQTPNVFDATANVGYSLTQYFNGSDTTRVNEYDRTGLLFDLSQLSGHTIVLAALSLTAQVSYHSISTGQNPNTLGSMSPQLCVATIAFGTDTWWQNHDLMSTSPYLHPGTPTGPSVGFDVSSAVVKWTKNPSSNFGFVLTGSYENNGWQGNGSQACMTTLNSERLVVTYL